MSVNRGVMIQDRRVVSTSSPSLPNKNNFSHIGGIERAEKNISLFSSIRQYLLKLRIGEIMFQLFFQLLLCLAQGMDFGLFWSLGLHASHRVDQFFARLLLLRQEHALPNVNKKNEEEKGAVDSFLDGISNRESRTSQLPK